jgi:putative endonuclease
MRTRVKGKITECFAAWYLRARGYRILGRNVATPFGEIDIIAEKKDELCFIEVRYRKTSDFGTPCETVFLKKQRRIIKSAKFLLLAGGYRDTQLRFDVIGVTRKGLFFRIDFIPNAFGGEA